MKAAFVTFGCKINYYDTQAIRETVLDLGYEEVPGAADGRGLRDLDLVVVNSCTVTGHAGERGARAVRQLSRRNPAAKILVTGCLTQEDRDAVTGIPGVEYVIGNEEKDQIPSLLQGAAVQPTRGRRSRDIFNLEASHFEGRTRAFLKVHDGCDSMCSYCIIPFVRGKSKSRSSADVVAEAGRFASAGHREIVLTGIHLRQYGRDLQSEGSGLVGLIRELRAIPGIDRVRLSSIGEGAFSTEFVDLFASDPGCCPFFHIPLQSGSTTVLDRMRRGYSAAEYLGVIEHVRAQLPHALITTDLMVGFPGETEAEFEESLETCRSARFGAMHLFPYSVRPGTRAAKLEGHLAPTLKDERMARARIVRDELAHQERVARIGRTMQVLVEKHQDGVARGLSREGFVVSFDSPGALRGEEVSVRTTEVTEEGLRAWI